MKNLLLLAGLAALFLAVLVLAQSASADGGGFPTATFTATWIPFSTITLAPPPVILLNTPVFPTVTPEINALLSQPQFETPVVLTTPVPAPRSRLSLLACWPLAIVFLLVALVAGAVIFGRRVW